MANAGVLFKWISSFIPMFSWCGRWLGPSKFYSFWGLINHICEGILPGEKIFVTHPDSLQTWNIIFGKTHKDNHQKMICTHTFPRRWRGCLLRHQRDRQCCGWCSLVNTWNVMKYYFRYTRESLSNMNLINIYGPYHGPIKNQAQTGIEKPC